MNIYSIIGSKIADLFTSSFIASTLLFLLNVGVFYLFAKRNGSDIVKDLKGKNGHWEPPEVLVIIWIIVFPPMAIADYVFGMVASNGIITIMNTILLFALAGKVGLEYVRKE